MLLIEGSLLLVVRLLLSGQGRWDIDFHVTIEERKKLIVLALREGGVLGILALRAAKRHTEKNLGGRIDAIHHLLHSELFRIDPTFSVGQRIAVEPGGSFLFHAGAG